MINRILVLYDGNKAHIFCLVNEFLFFFNKYFYTALAYNIYGIDYFTIV